jgi:DeoR family ulaG and ulaABCDEF operon transcriptional repressor
LILCPLERVSCVITDEAVPAASVQMLEAAGVKVIAVAPELVQ